MKLNESIYIRKCKILTLNAFQAKILSTIWILLVYLCSESVYFFLPKECRHVIPGICSPVCPWEIFMTFGASLYHFLGHKKPNRSLIHTHTYTIFPLSLAVQNSSIGDLVPWLFGWLVCPAPLTIRVFTTLQSDPRDR